jgi:hypothetical protein
MPTVTYIPLANVTFGSATSSVTFSSIPGTYRDLVLIFVGSGSTNIAGRLRFNGDSSANYGLQRMNGNGSAAVAENLSSQTSGLVSVTPQATTTSALQMKIDIFDYARTDKHKTFLSRAGNAVNATEASAHRWANTSAITSVQIFANTGNWSIGTTAALYGIVA